VTPVQTTQRESPATRGRVRWLGARIWLLATGLALLVGAAALVLLLASDDDGGGGDRPLGVPREVSVQQLRSAAEETDHPVYWAGAMPGRKLELTENTRGHLFVRYLPAGAGIGDERPAFTTVGTYPHADAYQATERSAARRGSIRRDAPGGGIAVWTLDNPTSVYLAYPGTDVLVEVYDPEAARAHDLALSGEVGPVR
jgi:hypothetical protein